MTACVLHLDTLKKNHPMMFKSCVWGLRIAIERENMPLKKWPPSERTPDRQGCRRHMDRASFTLTTGIQLLN